VLVADDDAAYRLVLGGLLADAAGTVVEASDGSQAWDQVRAVRPTAVLLDVRMPILNGDAVLAAMRRDPDLQDVPVVLLSSGVAPTGDELPGAVFVSKQGLDRDGLLGAVAEAARRSGGRP
jgi:CheY-like chemotaxis protein